MVAHRYSCDYGGGEGGREEECKETAAKNLTCPCQSYTQCIAAPASLPYLPVCPLRPSALPTLSTASYSSSSSPSPYPPSIRFGFCQFEMRFVIHILHENAKRQSVINCLKKRQHGVRAAGGADSRFTCLKFIFKRAVLAGWRGGEGRGRSRRGTNTIKTDIKMPEKYTFFSILTGCASCLTGAEAVCVCVGICVSVCWFVCNTQVKLLNHSYSTCI